MKLVEYLDWKQEKPSDFARRIDVGPSTIHRYTHKGRIPRRAIMDRIDLATDHHVRPADFYEIAS